MEGMALGAVVGFFAGSFGYIMIRFFISPIWSYRKLKKKVNTHLLAADKIAGVEKMGTEAIRTIDGFRFLAKEMTETVEDLMPVWFRLSLTRSGEDPLQAATQMMALANIRTPGHLVKRIQSIRSLLRLA